MSFPQEVKPVPKFSLSGLSPGDYPFAHGTITILPSRVFLVNCRENLQELKQVNDVLLANPETDEVSPDVFYKESTLIGLQVRVYGRQTYDEVGPNLLQTRRPKASLTVFSLASPYNAIYSSALDHLEEVKERTPMVRGSVPPLDLV